jgi:hypothetical protein
MEDRPLERAVLIIFLAALALLAGLHLFGLIP